MLNAIVHEPVKSIDGATVLDKECQSRHDDGI